MKTPSPFVQCSACHYHWAWAVSPRFCPSCAHEQFTDWTPPPPAVALARARVPLPDEGIHDGGTPYTAPEIAEMFRDELYHELGIHPHELPQLMA